MKTLESYRVHYTVCVISSAFYTPNFR